MYTLWLLAKNSQYVRVDFTYLFDPFVIFFGLIFTSLRASSLMTYSVFKRIIYHVKSGHKYTSNTKWYIIWSLS